MVRARQVKTRCCARQPRAGIFYMKVQETFHHEASSHIEKKQEEYFEQSEQQEQRPQGQMSVACMWEISRGDTGAGHEGQRGQGPDLKRALYGLVGWGEDLDSILSSTGHYWRFLSALALLVLGMDTVAADWGWVVRGLGGSGPGGTITRTYKWVGCKEWMRGLKN